MSEKKYRNPVPTVDVFIMTPSGVVLITRKNPPLGVALPGGFVNEGERFEDAARREAIEETGMTDIKITEQFYTYTDRMRDPRSHITSTVYLATSHMAPVASDDAATARIVTDSELLKMLNDPNAFAFDHGKIIRDVTDYVLTGVRRYLG